MVDCLGRRLTACVCLVGACVAALAFAFAPPQPLWSVTAACIFNGISVGGWNALDLLSAELFATEVCCCRRHWTCSTFCRSPVCPLPGVPITTTTTPLPPPQVRSTAMGLLGAGGRLASFATTAMAGGAARHRA
jgi:MFS family permease